MVDRLLQAAREGHSGVLVLRGEAGVGKSALLAWAAERAADVAGGMTVLRAGGVESEVQLPFAALHQLLRPLLDRLGRLPAVQAAALRTAFGLAGPPGGRDPSAERAGGRLGDRFLLSVGVLSLLADAAEQRPLVCLVDDAHWLDRASADALVFAARRLGAEGIGLVFAARDAEPRGFDAPGLPELRLGGLDSGAAARLLADAARAAPAAGVAAQLLVAAGGNPLALLELPAALSAAQLAGRSPLPDPLPVGAGVQRAFAERAGRLPAAARIMLLLLAAADDTGEAATVWRAAGGLGLDAGALGPAEAARLVRVGGRASSSGIRWSARRSTGRPRSPNAAPFTWPWPARWRAQGRPTGGPGTGRPPRPARTRRPPPSWSGRPGAPVPAAATRRPRRPWNAPRN